MEGLTSPWRIWLPHRWYDSQIEDFTTSWRIWLPHGGSDFPVKIWLPHGGYDSLIEDFTPSWRIRLPHERFDSLMEDMTPSLRVWLPYGGFYSLMEDMTPSWRILLPHTSDMTPSWGILFPDGEYDYLMEEDLSFDSLMGNIFDSLMNDSTPNMALKLCDIRPFKFVPTISSQHKTKTIRQIFFYFYIYWQCFFSKTQSIFLQWRV